MADRPMIGEHEAPKVKQPRGLLLVLLVLVVLGVVSTAATILNGYATSAASKAELEHNGILTTRLTDLTKQLAANQEATASSAEKFRNDSRRQITSLCVQIHAIAQELQVMVPPCPTVPQPRNH